ncbi:DUF445 domain-containing protein [Ectobacillus panaciterrae]|uniref:DUF445 domain-containing protein n=1 Tax=Ectobacillus panaciterrae TaxID=363872 RepID=UPI00040BC49E|nr:DUF445 domain-containing protein [Ectobacillus panaciterrae]
MVARSKYLAGSSLAFMGVGFIITLPFQSSAAGTILQGGFESGLVGGLADWFAVTALFRHPMGIPIPHTALLPKNRQRVTKGLIHMLENEWLTKESITGKLKQMQLAEKILTILEEKLHSDSVKKAISIIAQQTILNIHTEQIAAFIEKEVKAYLSSVNTASLLKSAIDQVIAHKYEEMALDYVLIKTKEWTEKAGTRNQLGNLAMKAIQNIELDGFLQFALKSFMNVIDAEKLGGILQDLIIRGVQSLQDGSNENRQALLNKIRTELEKGKENDQLLKGIETWKENMIVNWDASKQINEVLQQTKQKGLLFVKDAAFVDTYALPFLTRLLDHIKKNPEYVSNIENVMQVQIAQLIEKNHSKIGKLVQENLDKLDDETLISMIENNVGKDLQWIRVNGAVCGFFIGLCLEGIKFFI